MDSRGYGIEVLRLIGFAAIAALVLLLLAMSCEPALPGEPLEQGDLRRGDDEPDHAAIVMWQVGPAVEIAPGRTARAYQIWLVVEDPFQPSDPVHGELIKRIERAAESWYRLMVWLRRWRLLRD